ncbi:unnamed protein product [Linum trigynum]|uniref:Uncharacterized protein n=1 Tax=Linum trigynum TaxID=586398 RepID=A0AAV2DJV2_9ROSI
MLNLSCPQLNGYDDYLQWAVRTFKGKKALAMVGRLVWNLAVSLIWRERCGRLYGSSAMQFGELIRTVRRTIELARHGNAALDTDCRAIFSQ